MTDMKKRVPWMLMGMFMAFPALSVEKPDPTLTLKIGDPRLKDKTVEVAPRVLYSAASGRAIPFDRMIAEVKGIRIIYVGETHDSLPMHDVEFKVLEALYAQDRDLGVGLEMLPVACQKTLNRWSLGLLTKEEFIREVGWYVHWNFNFRFYEKIFDFAREHRLPVYALNAPREVITKIRMRGWDALTAEEKTYFPGAPDLTNQDHRALIRAVFESADLPPQMKGAGLDVVFDGLYRSQSAWDAVMAANTLRGAEMEGRRMVVFAGSGHLLYNLGINRRAFERSRLAFRTVIPVSVPKDMKTITAVRSLGDYIWGMEEEAKPAYPSVALVFKQFEALENLVVDAKPTDGAAKEAEFEKGDVVLSVDGKPFSDINELRTYLAGFGWGTETKFRVLRSGQVRDIVLKFDPATLNEKK